MTLTRDMIAMDVDYEQLGFIESHLMHEVKRLGEREFVEKYKDSIRDITSNNYEFNFVLSLLQHFNEWDIELPEKMKLEKYVIDPYDYYGLEDMTELDIELLSKNAMKRFMDNNIIKYKIEEAF